MLIFLPLNKIWVVTLPSVTSSHPLSSQGADQAPCPAGAFSRGSWALSGAPDLGIAPPVHPTHAFARMHPSALQASAPRASVSWLALLEWHKAPQTQHISSELAAFLPHVPRPLLCSPTSGAASSLAGCPRHKAQCPFTFIHVAPIPSGGLLKFSPFSVAMVPGQPTTSATP